MGTEALWVPAVIAAVGAGANAVNQRNVAKKTDQIAAQGIRTQGQHQRDIDARVNEELAALNRSTPEGERAAALDAYTSQLQRGRAEAEGGLTGIAGSNRFQTDQAAAKTAVGNYGEQIANIASRIDAPTRQREREGISARRTASDVAGIGRKAEADDYINRLLQQSVRGNDALSILGPVAQGVAAGMSANAGSVPTNAETYSMLAPSRNAVSTMFKGARRMPITI